MTAEPIRPAASLVLVRRDRDAGLRFLFGQRGGRASFMPSHHVFPGGAVDAGDRLPPPLPLASPCTRRLGEAAPGLLGAAFRELDEETGLHLRPAAASLRFVFRAITPPGNTRRFDARFFMADAGALGDDPDDFSRASGELEHLHWTSLDDARHLRLAGITRAVLQEVARLAMGGAQHDVPFYDGRGEHPAFRRIR